ncbi:S9 family peptidase [Mesobacillus subterraneus]|uniref:S9 family peptidase n=1 Tax=Mesobacillus subterraneus TaxID=285983 RepID=UPI00203FD10A|nr:S9 family peptidase [Mesobacillus subterraneus]MCM3666318.1 S9 family peptidase [Mesobacillus subterraneus]MCM3685316.1 S9 family peptidase [Mesobacillus subterraneus]
MVTFKKPDIENFYRTFNIQAFTVSPDESQLVFSTNLTGKYNLWAMDLPNQYPYPLTFIDQSCQALTYSHDGRFLVVGFDQDGDENTQLYALSPAGGELVALRTEEGHRHMLPFLSKDDKRLYYTSTKGNETYLNIYRYNLEKDEESVVVEGDGAACFLVAVDENETNFVYIKQYANTYSPGFVFQNGQSYSLTPETEEQFTVGDGVFVENEYFFLTTYGEDFAYLAKFNLDSHEFGKVLSIEKEEFGAIRYDKSTKSLYLLTAKGVNDYLYHYDLADGTHKKIELPASIVQGGTVADSGNLYILAGSATKPFNIFVKEAGNDAWKQLTNLAVPGVKEEHLVKPEVLTYPSYDGLMMEALFFKAKEDVNNGHVILWPHGGPQAAERNNFRAMFQFLVNRGYSIFAPNFRGSTGYGLEFMKMVEGNWGEGPRLDNIAGLEYLYENGLADRKRTLLMGGSYGGYMALLLHGRHPEYFKAVVDIFGPSNLFSFIESVPEHWKPVMNQWVGDPVKDFDKLTEFSPITYLENMTKPMLIIQGAKDPRVVKQESDQIFKALQEKGRDVKYLVLEDEGHGFSKKENEILVNRTILEFFDQFVEAKVLAE